MASKGFAVDKLAAKEVLETYVKAAEDMDLPDLAIHLGDHNDAARASKAVEYHCRRAVRAILSTEEAQS